MNGNQYQLALDRLGLTQGQAADVFRADARTSRRWRKDGPPAAIAVLLRLALDGLVSIDEIAKLIAKEQKP